MSETEDAEVNLFKMSMLGYIVYKLFDLDQQGEDFQDILKYIGVGFCVCYGRYSDQINPAAT